MYKKLILYISLALNTTLLVGASQTIYLPSGTALTQAIETIATKKNQSQIEFAFDIHKVILEERIQDQIGTLVKRSNKLQLLSLLFKPLLMIDFGKIGCQALLHAVPWTASRYKEVTSEQMFSILKYHGKEHIIDLVIQILNTQKVNTQVEKIILELKQNGYTMRIASNISTRVYKKLKQQFERNGTNVFRHFDIDQFGFEGKTIDYSVSTIQKPELEYFQQYIDSYNAEGKKLIIFIDDKLENITAAIKLGFIGIHFLNSDQLKADLISLKLL